MKKIIVYIMSIVYLASLKGSFLEAYKQFIDNYNPEPSHLSAASCYSDKIKNVYLNILKQHALKEISEQLDHIKEKIQETKSSSLRWGVKNYTFPDTSALKNRSTQLHTRIKKLEALDACYIPWVLRAAEFYHTPDYAETRKYRKTLRELLHKQHSGQISQLQNNIMDWWIQADSFGS